MSLIGGPIEFVERNEDECVVLILWMKNITNTPIVGRGPARVARKRVLCGECATEPQRESIGRVLDISVIARAGAGSRASRTEERLSEPMANYLLNSPAEWWDRQKNKKRRAKK